MVGMFDGGKVTLRLLSAAALLGAFLFAPGAWSQEEREPLQLSALPSTGRVDYEVIRKGEKIGTHSVVFRHDGRDLEVATWTDIAVKLLGVTLYRFRYQAEESWIDGQLTRLTSRTDNDGEPLTVNLAKTGDRIRGTCNGIPLDLPADTIPISVWHPDFIRQSVILDQYKCAAQKVRTADQGTEFIPAGPKSVKARHYALSGDVRRDVWYGPDGQTLQVLFPAKDGSKIAFVMRPSPPPAAARSLTKSSAESAP
ncbi:MAG: DUF6134 family protein [Dongiaceae bacterium]